MQQELTLSAMGLIWANISIYYRLLANSGRLFRRIVGTERRKIAGETWPNMISQCVGGAPATVAIGPPCLRCKSEFGRARDSTGVCSSI